MVQSKAGRGDGRLRPLSPGPSPAFPAAPPRERLSARPDDPSPGARAGARAPPLAEPPPARLRADLARLCGQCHRRGLFLLPQVCEGLSGQRRCPGWPAGPARLLSARRREAGSPARAAP
ncbi:unnamed protein product [Rangifer tarandus platyrhynchus]|uniref:Uncharacterized protein n=2 Tax=Rangifer tarandus platyrhynchus TaxID=3082113 RepID=A0ACB0ECF1_RANTA|nr:unnamed protein product [Rangifer tarandus platyrhynchus]CAI9698275.1 unnamed protein product [Rangifer tarandus platyrhynchus]